MRVIIAGSRDIYLSINQVEEIVLKSKFDVSSVVCGMARGVDSSGFVWAQSKSVPVYTYPADWNQFGKSAGYRRNVQMAENADALIAVTNGSKGTGYMIDIARSKGLQVFVKDWLL